MRGRENPKDAPKTKPPRDARRTTRRTAARRVSHHRSYGWDTGADLIALVRNGTWEGDVLFPVAACALPSTASEAPGYLRELADARLGFSIVARGPVLFTEATRVAMLSELDASRAVIGSDLVRLPEGERLTERQIFVDPVVAHPEEAPSRARRRRRSRRRRWNSERTTRARRRN